MVLACPNCGSDEVRLSRRTSLKRELKKLLGIYSFRCECCDTKFAASISNLSHVIYAKCPCCHRMDLSRWSREFYNPSTTTKVMLAIGAKPVRCEYCRKNFWSFRLVRERFNREKRAARSKVVIPASVKSLATAVGSSEAGDTAQPEQEHLVS